MSKPSTQRTLPVLVALLLFVAPAAADDKPAGKAKPLSPQQAADKVLEAVKAKDEKALKALAEMALAEKDQPDPWLVADLLCYRGDHDAAEAFAKAAQHPDIERLPGYVEAWRKRQPDKAEREHLDAMLAALRERAPQKAIEIANSLDLGMDTLVRVRLRSVCGLALRSMGGLEESHTMLDEAGDAALALGWLRGAARLFVEASTSAFYGSAWPRALASTEKLLALSRRRGDKWGATWTLGNLGVLYKGFGDYTKALSTFEQVLADKKALGDAHGVGTALEGMGNVYSDMGEFSKALAAYGRARKQFEALGDRLGAARTLGNEGIVYRRMGDAARALSTFEEARETMEALGDRRGAVLNLGNIGVIHSDLGNDTKALSIFNRVLAQQEALQDGPGATVALGNIGSIYVRLGRPAEALETLQRTLARHEAMGSRVRAAQTLGSIGNVYATLGKPAKAIATLEQAQAKLEAMGDRSSAARLLLDVGDVHFEQGNIANARGFFKKGKRAALSLRATPLLVRALTSLARLHLQGGESSSALSAAQSALRELEGLLGGLGEEQGAMAREQYVSLFTIGALAATREEDAAELLTFLESGRAGALLDALDKREALRWKADSLSPQLRRLDLEAQAAERRARYAYDHAVRRGGDLAKMRVASKALDEASAAVRDVAGRIQRELKQQANLFYPRARTIDEIERGLEPDQALVLYGLCLDEALALVLRKGEERIVPLGPMADVVAACEALDASDPSVDTKAPLDSLRKLLVDPLELGQDVKQVLVSPEGPVCYMPFGALFEKRAVAMTPSGTTHVLLRNEGRAKGEGILALGAPDYRGGSEGAQAIYYRGRTLAPLPASRTEVETIASKTLLGEKASEAGLRKALGASKRWRAVHFACHGLVDIDRPMLSSLALTRAGDDDGFLTALEILRTEIPADLAVLSACKTATGKIVKGEGIVGLTRAFMFAGSPRVICSLWKVDDEATQALMIRFYELWAPQEPTALSDQRESKGRLGAAEALKKAQEHIKGQERWKHPYYWAAWVLWGLPH